MWFFIDKNKHLFYNKADEIEKVKIGANKLKKIGFTIGKYAPYHIGHKFLIETALKDMDEFYVVVYDTPELNIKIEDKIKWIQSDFPDVKILKAYNSPKQYGLDEESVKIQMEYLCKIIGDAKFTHFYSSEEYGRCVADYLGIQNVVVDKERKIFNVRASDIRGDVEKFKMYLNDEVYRDLK